MGSIVDTQSSGSAEATARHHRYSWWPVWSGPAPWAWSAVEPLRKGLHRPVPPSPACRAITSHTAGWRASSQVLGLDRAYARHSAT